MYGRHIFGRRLMRRYGNDLATDEVYDVAIVRNDWNGVTLDNLNQELTGMWQDVVLRVTNDGARPRDLIRIRIGHQDLQHDEIKIPLQRINKLTPEGIMQRIATVMQSHRQMMVDGVADISVGVIRLPHGEARQIITSLNYLSKKRSLTFINNEDDMCLPRAIIMA